MHSHTDTAVRLRALAAAQGGVISTEQTLLARLPRDTRRQVLRDGR